MNFAPFALDHWLHQHRALPLQLASSAGPAWTLGELLAGSPPATPLEDLVLGLGDINGGPALREAIAGLYSSVDPDHVQVTVGGQEALLIALALAAEPGANVVLPDPCYPGISELARAFGFELRHYRLLPERRFEIAAADVEKRLNRRTRLVVINSPHNPTGAVAGDDVLLRLADAAHLCGARLLCDEVFHPLRSNPAAAAAARSAADLAPDALVISNLSKAFSLPGLRLGWIVDRDAGHRARVLDAHAYFCTAHSPLCEALATAALAMRATILERARTTIARNTEVLASLVGRSDGCLSWVPPAGGTTVFPWLTEDDARPFCTAMAARGVVLAPGDCFGRPAHFRIGLGGDPERFAEGARRIGEELASMGRRYATG